MRITKEEILEISNTLISLKNEHETNIARSRNIMNGMLETWQSETVIAFDECLLSMTSTFNRYSQLLEDFSSTIIRMTNNSFNNDSQYANEVLVRLKIHHNSTSEPKEED